MVHGPPWKPRRASVPSEAGAYRMGAGERDNRAQVLLRGVVVIKTSGWIWHRDRCLKFLSVCWICRELFIWRFCR